MHSLLFELKSIFYSLFMFSGRRNYTPCQSSAFLTHSVGLTLFTLTSPVLFEWLKSVNEWVAVTGARALINVCMCSTNQASFTRLKATGGVKYTCSWRCDVKTDSDSLWGTPNNQFYRSGLREGRDQVWLFLTGLFSGWFCQKEQLRAMEQALNSTIHPACLQEPPLAIDVIKRKCPRSCLLIMFPYQAAKWQQQFTHSSSWVSGMFGLISFENRTKYS